MSFAKRTVASTMAYALLCLAIPICSGQDSRQDTDQKLRDLEFRHAKAKLELAEVELEMAQNMNENGVNSLPRLAIERFKSNLAIAHEQFKQTSVQSTGGPEQVRIRHAKEKVRIAKIDFEAGKRLRRTETISKLELRRLELNFELAKLNMAMLSNPGTFVTLVDSRQRQLDRFGKEILSLDQRISKLESNR